MRRAPSATDRAEIGDGQAPYGARGVRRAVVRHRRSVTRPLDAVLCNSLPCHGCSEDLTRPTNEETCAKFDRPCLPSAVRGGRSGPATGPGPAGGVLGGDRRPGREHRGRRHRPGRQPGPRPDGGRLRTAGGRRADVPIDYFTEIAEGRALATADGEAVAGVPNLEPDAPVGTSFLLFIDDFFTIKRDRDRVIDRLEKDLTQLGPADRVAAVSFDGKSVDMLTTWTNSPSELSDALREARRRKAHGLMRIGELRTNDQERSEQSELRALANRLHRGRWRRTARGRHAQPVARRRAALRDEPRDPVGAVRAGGRGDAAELRQPAGPQGDAPARGGAGPSRRRSTRSPVAA